MTELTPHTQKKTHSRQMATSCESCGNFVYDEDYECYTCEVDLDEDEIADYITDHFEGNSLIAAGDEDLVKIHFHTNEPWKVLEYCSTLGEIYDIVVEDMDRQSRGLKG